MCELIHVLVLAGRLVAWVLLHVGYIAVMNQLTMSVLSIQATVPTVVMEWSKTQMEQVRDEFSISVMNNVMVQQV